MCPPEPVDTEPPRLILSRIYRNGLLELVWPRLETRFDQEAILNAGVFLCLAYAVIGYLSYWVQNRSSAGLILFMFFLTAGLAIKRRSLQGPVYWAAFLLAAVIFSLFSPFGLGPGVLFFILAALPTVAVARAIRAEGTVNKSSAMRALQRVLLPLLFAGACGAVLFGTVCGLFEVQASDASMLPTMSPRSWLLGVNLSAGEPISRSELVEVNAGTIGVVRIIGLPGDRVQIKAGQLVLNGIPVRERYTRPYAAPDGDFPLPSAAYPIDYLRWEHDLAYPETVMSDQPYRIPAGKYFMLNDNRRELSDSRTMGPFPRSYIIAKVILAYEPRGFLLSSPRLLR